MTEQSLNQLLETVEQKPSIGTYFTVAEKIRVLADEQIHLPQIRISILSSFTIDPLVPVLEVTCYQAGLRPEIYLGGFNQVQQEILDPHSPLYQFKPDVLIVAVRLQELAPRLWDDFLTMEPVQIEAEVDGVLDTIQMLLGQFRQRSDALVIVHDFEQPSRPDLGLLDGKIGLGQRETIQRINLSLVDAIRPLENVYLLSYNDLVADHGRRNWTDTRMWMLARMPIAASFLPVLAREYLRFFMSLKGLNRKCLVTDLDDTLWGGILGEDGAAGIKLGTDYPGNTYLALQKEMLKLYHKGILLAINSKNNESEVMDVLRNHPGMLLREEHFVAIKANWQDKARNMREIAADLNIGIDSLAFIDDSPVERELMQRELPEVLTIELPDDPALYASTLRNLPHFEILSLSEEDRKRSAMYRAQSARRHFQASATSLEDFYAGLEMKATIASVNEYSIARAAQMTMRTNQFNLTTRRYTESDIRHFIESTDYLVYTLALSDKFGDNGIVGLAIIQIQEAGWGIDTFLLSCRVIGRTVETALLAYLAHTAKESGAKILTGTYIPTKKNVPAKGFYSQHGFELVSSERGITHWRLDLQSYQADYPEWIAINTIE